MASSECCAPHPEHEPGRCEYCLPPCGPSRRCYVCGAAIKALFNIGVRGETLARSETGLFPGEPDVSTRYYCALHVDGDEAAVPAPAERWERDIGAIKRVLRAYEANPGLDEHEFAEQYAAAAPGGGIDEGEPEVHRTVGFEYGVLEDIRDALRVQAYIAYLEACKSGAVRITDGFAEVRDRAREGFE